MKVCTGCGAEYGDEVLFCQRDGTPLRPADQTAELIGQVVADRYHIQKKLGEGGMGQVYLAEHVKMGRRCAIKIMSPTTMNDPEAISRFNREAANASRISHPNVCAIYDFGETAEGLIYLAMEFIDGRSLTDLLRESSTLTLPRAAGILAQSAEALQAAHDLGIVHRDLKPDNIMVTTTRGRDTIKVVDFGIAKATGAAASGQKVTKTGLVVGTPEYMSPEQLAGDQVDGRSDLYSLALVFYRMITGILPFEADSAQETMIKRLTDDPLPLAAACPDTHFPPGLQGVMDRALARWPQQRYATATEFARDARAAVGSVVGRVDLDAGTQVVEAGQRPQGTVPATRVDPVAAREKARQRAPAPAPAGPQRWMPRVLPMGAAFLVLGAGAAAFALRDKLFVGSTARDPTRTAFRPDSVALGGQNGANLPDGSSRRLAGARDVTAGSQQRDSTPPSIRDTAARRNDSGMTATGSDYRALGEQVRAFSADIDFVDSPAKRDQAKELGQRVWQLGQAPSGLRADAAFIVGYSLIAEGDREGARLWIQRAVDLNPSDTTWKKILRQI